VSIFRVALGFLALAGLIAVLGPVIETRQRAPEGIARAYLRAVEAGDVDGAVDTLDPALRMQLRERVALQARNRYAIVTVVLGQPSVFDRLTGGDLPPAWVIVTAEVTTAAGERWQSASTAPLIQRDGVWYLSGPLFA
jgi:hypothetical protein